MLPIPSYEAAESLVGLDGLDQHVLEDVIGDGMAGVGSSVVGVHSLLELEEKLLDRAIPSVQTSGAELDKQAVGVHGATDTVVGIIGKCMEGSLCITITLSKDVTAATVGDDLLQHREEPVLFLDELRHSMGCWNVVGVQ